MLNRKSFLLLLPTLAMSLVLAFYQNSASAIGGRDDLFGFFDGNPAVSGPANYGDMLPSGLNGICGAGGDEAQKRAFISKIEGYLNSGTAREKTSAAAIIQLMRPSSSTTYNWDRTPSSKQKADWRDRILNPDVNLDCVGAYSYSKNTGYQKDYNDMASWSQSGTVSAIVFYIDDDKNGSRSSSEDRFAIKIDCGQPINNLRGLPIVNYIIEGKITLQAEGGIVTSELSATSGLSATDKTATYVYQPNKQLVLRCYTENIGSDRMPPDHKVSWHVHAPGPNPSDVDTNYHDLDTYHNVKDSGDSCVSYQPTAPGTYEFTLSFKPAIFSSWDQVKDWEDTKKITVILTSPAAGYNPEGKTKLTSPEAVTVTSFDDSSSNNQSRSYAVGTTVKFDFVLRNNNGPDAMPAGKSIAWATHGKVNTGSMPSGTLNGPLAKDVDTTVATNVTYTLTNADVGGTCWYLSFSPASSTDPSTENTGNICISATPPGGSWAIQGGVEMTLSGGASGTTTVLLNGSDQTIVVNSPASAVTATFRYSLKNTGSAGSTAIVWTARDGQTSTAIYAPTSASTGSGIAPGITTYPSRATTNGAPIPDSGSIATSAAGGTKICRYMEYSPTSSSSVTESSTPMICVQVNRATTSSPPPSSPPAPGWTIDSKIKMDYGGYSKTITSTATINERATVVIDSYFTPIDVAWTYYLKNGGLQNSGPLTWSAFSGGENNTNNAFWNQINYSGINNRGVESGAEARVAQTQPGLGTLMSDTIHIDSSTPNGTYCRRLAFWPNSNSSSSVETTKDICVEVTRIATPPPTAPPDLPDAYLSMFRLEDNDIHSNGWFKGAYEIARGYLSAANNIENYLCYNNISCNLVEMISYAYNQLSHPLTSALGHYKQTDIPDLWTRASSYIGSSQSIEITANPVDLSELPDSPSGIYYYTSATQDLHIKSNPATAANIINVPNSLSGNVINYNGGLLEDLICTDYNLGYTTGVCPTFSTAHRKMTVSRFSKTMTIVADRKVYIDSNIIRDPSSYSAKAENRPTLGIIARNGIGIGGLYPGSGSLPSGVSKGVVNVQAFLYSKDGDIDTCYQRTTGAGISEFNNSKIDTCRYGLYTEGFYMAKNIYLSRTGALRNTIRDKVTFNPLLYINPPPLFETIREGEATFTNSGERPPLK